MLQNWPHSNRAWLQKWTVVIRTPVAGDAISDNIQERLVLLRWRPENCTKGVVPKPFFGVTLGSVTRRGFLKWDQLTAVDQKATKSVGGPAPSLTRKGTSKGVECCSGFKGRGMDKNRNLTTYLNVSPSGRKQSGNKILRSVEAAAPGIFGVSAKDPAVPQAALYRWLATKSDCLLLMLQTVA